MIKERPAMTQNLIPFLLLVNPRGARKRPSQKRNNGEYYFYNGKWKIMPSIFYYFSKDAEGAIRKFSQWLWSSQVKT